MPRHAEATVRPHAAHMCGSASGATGICVPSVRLHPQSESRSHRSQQPARLSLSTGGSSARVLQALWAIPWHGIRTSQECGDIGVMSAAKQVRSSVVKRGATMTCVRAVLTGLRDPPRWSWSQLRSLYLGVNLPTAAGNTLMLACGAAVLVLTASA